MSLQIHKSQIMNFILSKLVLGCFKYFLTVFNHLFQLLFLGGGGGGGCWVDMPTGDWFKRHGLGNVKIKNSIKKLG